MRVLGLILAALALEGCATSTGRGLEVDGVVGYARPTSTGEDATSAGGPAASVAVRHRSPSHLGGFVEAGRARLFATERWLAGARPNQPVWLESTLDASLLVGGVSLDLSRLRIDAGIGLAILSMHAMLDGAEASTTSAGVAYAAALSGFVYQAAPLRLGGTLRGVIVSGTELRYLMVGLEVGGEVLTW